MGSKGEGDEDEGAGAHLVGTLHACKRIRSSCFGKRRGGNDNEGGLLVLKVWARNNATMHVGTEGWVGRSGTHECFSSFTLPFHRISRRTRGEGADCEVEHTNE